jgi:copper chaperone CopZ
VAFLQGDRLLDVDIARGAANNDAAALKRFQCYPYLAFFYPEETMRTFAMVMALCISVALAGNLRADTTVELDKVHLCCGACVNGVKNIVKKIDGVTVKCDQKEQKVTLTAPNDETALKAVEALAAGGYHGEATDSKFAMKEDSGASKGKVAELSVSGIHNCCPRCTSAINAAVKKVEGTKGNTLKPRQETFTVTGDFDAADLVKALNDAGFHVKVKK